MCIRDRMSSTIAISAAVGALIWLLLFNPSLGLLDYLLSLIGIQGPAWLIQPTTAIIAVSITTIWLTLGTNIIVLLSGLQGVPEEIYEAARLDGARGFRMFSRITVPMVSPSLFFLLVVDTIAVLQAVPEEIYEAARLDGARGFRMFSRITVPMVSPSLFFLLVVDTIAVLQ